MREKKKKKALEGNADERKREHAVIQAGIRYTHEYLKSLNKIACVMTRDCTLLVHNSCYGEVSYLEKQRPHPLLNLIQFSCSV